MSNFGTINPVICTNEVQGYDMTVTSGGTLTLTSASSQQQYFTGVTTHILKLPVVSTLDLGWSYTVTNNSTGNVTVQSSGANVIFVIPTLSAMLFTYILAGTGAASWNIYSYKTTIIGTANQITASAPTGAVTLSLPSAVSATNWTLTGLTPSQAVVTNGSDLLTSIPYTSTATPSSFVFRDANINTTLNNALTG